LGLSPEGLRDGSPPVGFRGEAPVEDLRDEVPQRLKQFLDFDCRNDQILKMYLLILEQCISRCVGG